MEQRIEAILAQMTLDEKISMLAGAGMWHTVPVKRVGIPQLKVTDGPNGARGENDNSGATSACFPVGTALGATWDLDLVEAVGAALADEVQAKGAHVLLAPTVNIHRSPIAGRNFECYSEDPYLTGMMATAYIRGLQKKGVGACIKHFVCNDSEFERTSMSSEVAERPLREIYLRPFEMAIRAVNPWSIMSAYNRINGRHASENDYTLLDILKGEWDYDGAVISDWYGTYSPNVNRSGLDLEMPGAARWSSAEHVKAGLEAGEFSEDHLTEKVRRLLRLMARTGALDAPELAEERTINTPEIQQLARRAAAESMVLLKNDNAILPLDATKIKRIAVIGENGARSQIMGGGSSAVKAHYAVSPLDGIKNYVGDDVPVAYAYGCRVSRNLPQLELSWLTTPDGERGLRLEYFANQQLAGEPVYVGTAVKSKLGWFGDTISGIPELNPADFSARLSGTFTPPVSGLYTFGLDCVGKGQLALDGVVYARNWDTPEGEMEFSIDLQAKQAYTLQVEYASQVDGHWRGLGIGCELPLPADPIADAVAKAKDADVAIVVAGLTGEWESEGFDRADMMLPGEQVTLIEQVAAANPNTVVVLNVGSPIEMPWLNKVAGVVQMWYGGQEMGNALADVLFGAVNPSAKLPTTFPQRLQDNPAYINYPGENGKVHYGEGLFVGYRYYEKKGIVPLFPFGYGLSYTTFAYDNLQLNQTKFGEDEAVQVHVDVTNTGDCAGQEVVQMYVTQNERRLERPLKELKAFTKIMLEAGETKTVTLRLDREALAYYDPAKPGWVTDAGMFTIHVGSSSQAIHFTQQIHWQGDNADGAEWHIGVKIGALLNNADSKAVLQKHIPQALQASEINMALEMTLAQIQPFAADLLTDAMLAAIDADLRAL